MQTDNHEHAMAALTPHESSWGGSRGCLGFYIVFLFSGLTRLDLPETGMLE
jgi:hypothetical protein